MRNSEEQLSIVKGKFPKIPEKVIEVIIKEYQKASVQTLLENGNVYFTPEIKTEIIPITPRRYVLRGKEYRSMRLYKLKSTLVDEHLYEDIEEEYNKFREDLD